jgi:hypothetical protein
MIRNLTWGRTFYAATNEEFTQALTDVQPGDTIRLRAGETFSDNFGLRRQDGLPEVIGNEQRILICSDAPDGCLPAEGERIIPLHARYLPKLVSPNALPALRTEAGARGYWLMGIEFTGTDPSSDAIIALGNDPQSIDEVPSDLILDRCYIHGQPGQAIRRGVALNSARTLITGCDISEFHVLSGGRESQAISGWNGPGPFQIVNCYLEAADECVLFGGQQPSITGPVNANIEFRGNWCRKPLSWWPLDPSYAGIEWRVKNLFELKNAQSVVIEGNIFENNWGGSAIVFTPRNQLGAGCGNAPQTVVQDVRFRNNIVRHSAMGGGHSRARRSV